MDDFVRDVYVREVETQCRLVRSAAARVEEALVEAGTRRTAEVFRNLHSLLTHASNVSRLLWPPTPQKREGETKELHTQRKNRTNARGLELRSLLGVPDLEHVLRDRTLRNHLEHFDERLDDWEQTTVRRNLAQDIIGPPNAIAGLDDGDAMRWFDPVSGTFHFRGEAFSVGAILEASVELLVGAIQSLSDPRVVELKLSEEFPDITFSRDSMIQEVSSVVFQDHRLKDTPIKSLRFVQNMSAALVDVGTDDASLSVPLGSVTIPGPRDQAAGIAELIVTAVTKQAGGNSGAEAS